MGNPKKDQRQPETATATAERPNAKVETKEAEKKLSYQELRDRAEKLESDPNFKAAEAISNLRGDVEPAQQIDGIAALNQALVNILVKLEKAGVDLTNVNDTASLQAKVNEAKKAGKIKLDTPEEVAMQNVNRVIKEGGPSSEEIKGSWGKRKEAAKDAGKGWGSKALDLWSKHPVGISALLIGGGALAYFSAEAMTTYVKKALPFTAKKNDPRGKFLRGGILAPGGLALACGIVAAGAFLGEKRLKRILAMVGLSSGAVQDMKERAKKGEEFTDEQKSKLKKGEKKIAEAVKAEREKESKSGSTGGRSAVAGGGAAVAGAAGAVGERLAETDTSEVVGETTEAPVETPKISEKVKEALAKGLKEGGFDAAKESFVALYFHGRREFGPDDSRRFKTVVNDLANEKVSTIKSVYVKHKSERKIPSSELPGIKTEISDKDLFLLVEGMVRFSVLAQTDKRDPDMSVKKMFESAFDNPMLDHLEGLNSGIVEALKEGDIPAAIAALAEKGANFSKKHGASLLQRLSTKFEIDLSHLSPKEKEAYIELQALLLSNALVSTDADEAISNQLNAHPKLKEYPQVIKLVKTFFEKVQNATPGILDHAYKRFGLEVNGKSALQDGVKYETLTFSSACELLALETALRDESDWATDLMIINVLLRSFSDPGARNRYIGHLAVELGKDASKIKLPALKNLREYLLKAGKIAGLQAGGWLLDWMQRGRGLTEGRPTDMPLGEVAEHMKSSEFLVSFAQEGVGTGLEITGGSLGAIISLLNLEKEIGGCETGQEFLELINVKGGKVGYFESGGSTPMIVIEAAGQIFLARPGKIIIESARSAADFTPGGALDAVKIWLSGSAFFVSLGGVYGFIKPARTPQGYLRYALRSQVVNAISGAAKGALYPVKAPAMFASGVKYSVQAGVSGVEGAKAVKGGVGEFAMRSYNWTRDVLRYGAPGQNVENMILTGKRLQYHSSMRSTGISAGLRGNEGWFERNIKLARARVRKAGEVAGGLYRKPGETLRMLTVGDFHRGISEKLAMRFAIQYNDFFAFEGIKVEAMTEDTLDSIVKLQERINGFLRNLKDNPKHLEEMVELASKYKGEELANKLTNLLKKLDLTYNEASALAKRMSDPATAKQVIEQLRRGVGHLDDVAKPSLVARSLKRAREAFQKKTTSSSTETGKAKETTSEAPEAVKGTVETEAAIAKAEKDLAKVRKQIASAESDMKAVEAMRKRSALGNVKAAQERVDQARKIIEDGKQAEKELEATIKAFRSLKQTEAALDAAKAAKDATKVASLGREVRAAASVAQDALESSTKTAANIGKLGRWGTAFKWGGRVLGGAGVGFSAFNAIGSGYEAITTDVEGRGTIKGVEAGFWTASAIADGAALAITFGVEGAAVTYASAAAAPLMPITYAVTTGAETLYEGTKTDAEWTKENEKDPYALLHHFYTSMNSVSLGDAWVGTGHGIIKNPLEVGLASLGGMSLGLIPGIFAASTDILETKGAKKTMDETYEARVETKKGTMRKIYRGLVAIQKDPSLLDELRQGKLTVEQLDKRIEKNYTKYHEFYFKYVNPVGMQSYGTAQRFVLEAQMFDDIMKKRDEARAKKQPFILMGKDNYPFKLHEDRYNINEDGTLSDGQRKFNPAHVVQSYKETMVRIFERDVVRKGNLDRMDSGYLIRLYVQIGKVLGKDSPFKAAIDREDGLREALVRQASSISNYLKCARNVSMAFAMRQPEYHSSPMSLEDIKKHLDGIDSVDNKAYLDFEKTNYQMTPALQAVYRLAEYFGYSGEPSEERLKLFFHKGAASYHGLYWDGSEWVLQERGWELDDSMGATLNDQMVEKVIKGMRDDPDDILEHRSDTLFMDAADYSAEVKRMAQILENGLKEGRERHYKTSWT